MAAEQGRIRRRLGPAVHAVRACGPTRPSPGWDRRPESTTGEPVDALRADDPRRVGPFRLLGRLGAGGMGQVYLGRGPEGRTVAVKRVRVELLDDEDTFRPRFAREVEAARRVRGPFTAPVVAADAYAEVPWLATAYIPGMALGEAVGAFGPLPPHTLGAVASGLADALVAMHAVGLVHRDLKPANVLLAVDGPIVIDFGIALLDGATALTRPGHTLGTLGFMSPEQFERADVGPASDVFSYGAVLAYAATGRLPFGSGPWPVLLANLTGRDPDLAGAPEAFLPLLRACLDKEPDRRPTPTLARALVPSGTGEDLPGGWLPAPLAHELLRIAGRALDAEGVPDPPGEAGPADQGGDGPPIACAVVEDTADSVGFGPTRVGAEPAGDALPGDPPVDLPAGASSPMPPAAPAVRGPTPGRGGSHRLPSTRSRFTVVITVAVAAALTAGLLVWRGFGDGASNTAHSRGAFRVGLLLPDDRAERTVRPAFEARIRRLCPGCSVRFAQAGRQPDVQHRQIDTMISAGVRVLVLGPVDPRDSAAAVTRARERDIPVVSFDKLAAGPVAGHVSFDFRAVGRLQAQALLDAVRAAGGPQRGSIVMLNGRAGDRAGNEIKRGAHGVLDGEVTIAREYDVDDAGGPKAQQVIADALTALGGPRQLIGVYAADDTLAAGALRGLTAAGVGPPVPLTGQDPDPAALRRIIAGTQTVSVLKPGGPEAEAAAEMAITLGRGEELSRVDVTRDNGTTQVPTVALAPVALTRGNVKELLPTLTGLDVREVCTAELASECARLGLG
ncbi:substrate-binding domain-containing protein [Embleya sp. NPDC020886]|uniref:bifunctional serine/threonine-protein kinase/ABC transporter substrate-binding protein n=1 Tax=Embleya sp. NPDC020886 TaxID=3363980 RepID=UPI00379136AD